MKKTNTWPAPAEPPGAQASSSVATEEFIAALEGLEPVIAKAKAAGADAAVVAIAVTAHSAAKGARAATFDAIAAVKKLSVMAVSDASEVEENQLLGTWRYASTLKYMISRDEQGQLVFDDFNEKVCTAHGILKHHGAWLQVDVAKPRLTKPFGTIRVRRASPDTVSNFKSVNAASWGPDTVGESEAAYLLRVPDHLQQRIGMGTQLSDKEASEARSQLMTAVARFLTYDEGHNKGTAFFKKQVRHFGKHRFALQVAAAIERQTAYLEDDNDASLLPLEVMVLQKWECETIVLATVAVQSWKAVWLKSFVIMIIQCYQDAASFDMHAVEGGPETRKELTAIEEPMALLGFKTIGFRGRQIIQGKVAVKWKWIIERKQTKGLQKALPMEVRLTQHKKVVDCKRAALLY